MKITYKCGVTVEGLQAALVSIHRIFFLLLALTGESWPEGNWQILPQAAML